MAQNHLYKSDGNSKQINISNNRGVININLDSKLYQELIDERTNLIVRKNILKEKIKNHPNDKDYLDDLTNLNEQIENSENNIKNYTQNFIKLYNLFTTIEINSEILKLAKTYFERGEFDLCNKLIKEEDLASNQTRLLNIKSLKENEIEKINSKLRENAYEYYIKAKVIQINLSLYDLKRNFNLINDYYQNSLKSFSLDAVLVDYIYFLAKVNDYEKMIPIYLMNINKLNNYYSEVFKNKELEIINEFALIELHLGGVYFYNDDNAAQIHLNKSLNFYNDLIALSKENVAIENRFDPLSFSSEYEFIGKRFLEKKNYIQSINAYEKALEINRDLSLNDSFYLTNIAKIKNIIGDTYLLIKDFNSAQKYLEESLENYSLMDLKNVEYELNDKIETIINLSIIYSFSVNELNKKESFKLRILALDLLANKEYSESNNITQISRIFELMIKIDKLDLKSYLLNRYGIEHKILKLVPMINATNR